MDPRELARLEELLAERATQGLPPDAERELLDLLAKSPGSLEDLFDLAAAAIELALLGPLDEMPADVRRRVSHRGHEWAEQMRRNNR